MKNTLPITLFALGSYGREQLCVYSDIDLMIVYKRTKGYNFTLDNLRGLLIGLMNLFVKGF
jgi:UTP:GlnB (protein PII) uridylyltransferase